MTFRSSAAGTVAKLIEEGYTGYLVRATNDDMGDAPGLGTPGTHRRPRARQPARHRRGGARSRLQVALRSELQQPPHGRCLAQRVDRPPDLPDSPGPGRHRRRLGSLGARRRESRSLHCGQGRRGRRLDGRPRARFRRALRRRPEAQIHSGQILFRAPSRDHPRRGYQPAGRTSVSTRFAPTSPKGPAAAPVRASAPNSPNAISAFRCWATTTSRPTATTSRNSASRTAAS